MLSARKAAITAILILILAWAPAPANGQAPTPGGKAVFGLNAGWDHLDPHRWTGFFFAQLIMVNIFDSLLVRDPKTAALRPGLAESYEVSGDGRTVTFKLQTGVKFHDGTVCDAAAVKASFDRILTDPKAVAVRSMLGPVDRVDATDARTVRFHLKEAFAPFLDALSLPMTAPVSMAAVQKFGDGFGQHPVGTGPFMFKELVPNERLVLVRNPDYRWAPSIFPSRGPVLLEELTYRVVPEDLTRLALLERNEVTFINYPVPREIARLKGDQRYRVVAVGRPGVPRMITLNTAHPPLDDLRVRTAIAAAINREGILKNVWEGVGSTAFSMLSPVTWGYAPEVEGMMPKFDPARARAILAEAGWRPGPDGFVVKDGKKMHLVMTHLTGGVFASLHQLIQAYLRSIGIDSELRGMEQAAALDALKRGDFDISANQINTASDPDVLYQVGHSSSIGPLWNTARVKNATLDRLLGDARVATDESKRRDLYRQIQLLLARELPYIPFYVQTDPYAMQASLEGVVYDVKSLPMFHAAFIRR